MPPEIKIGTLDEFFASAHETAKEIDCGKRVTPKNRIWIDPSEAAFFLGSPSKKYTPASSQEIRNVN